MCLIYNLFETKLILLKSDVIYYFESYALALWSVLVGVSVFHLPSSYKSLFSRCAKDWVVWNYILFNSLLRPFGCGISSFRVQQFSLIFNLFQRVNLSRFALLSCSISMNFACILKLSPSVSK